MSTFLVPGTEHCSPYNVVVAVKRLAERSGANDFELFEALSTALPTLPSRVVKQLMNDQAKLIIVAHPPGLKIKTSGKKFSPTMLLPLEE